MVFPESVASGALKLFHEILSDHNVRVQTEIPFVESKQQQKSVWQWINLSSAQNTESQASLFDDLGNQDYIHLEFPVRYQLEVCISNGWLSEFTMTREFVLKLRDLGEACARRLLEHVATERTTYLDPMEIFNIKMYKGVSDAKIPPYCCFMRTARITPTTVHYNTPTVDTSNRIIRRYIEHADQFLRVRFMDEKTIGRINSTIGDSQDEIYTRVKATLANGITIGDRHYEFLAFGNSQFREHGAYFFAPLPHLNAAMIRAWMGQLSHIRNVAKYAARLGQNFSTTRAFGGCKADVRLIEDIPRNGCIFSDGVGKISKFLVSMISGELGLESPGGQLPSAFQFRLGGCKGMLVVSSDPGPHEILIRKSQFKFESPHGGLEIIRCSKLSVATLNRQLILVLSSRGIRDEVFKEKLNNLIANFDEAMQNDAKAISMLRKFVDINQMSLCLARMIESGFRRSGEPFVKSVLALWKAWHLKLLKEKAKILIEQGANVLGCVDETGILKGYFRNSTFRDEASLPQIFLQISQPEKEGTSKIVTGVCIVARNPSLHPGDVRVVKAVDVPELRHLRDVVVFPQTGDQDIPGMCSGGDLDGDDYFIFWDSDLIPQNSEWPTEPMKFTSKKAPDLDHEVTVDEVTSFYVTYMKNDILPKVATAHMAWADANEEGICSKKCLRLAQLHSDAVDYNKTGGAAMMTRDLEPYEWPHFMEKRFVSAGKIYKSKKILGQLYDSVEKIHFVPHLGMPFNSPILNCKPELMILSEDFLQFARTLKSDYDSSIRRVMAQHGIKTEFEVWSSWILNHNNLSRDYNIQEDLGRISTLIRQGFRHQCYEKAGGRSFEALAPLVLAMYRVTHEDLVTAQEAAQESAGSEDGFDHDQFSDDPEPNMAKLPLISFPWLFDEYLGRISHGHLDLHAIQSFMATKAETPGSKFYTQEEMQQITADLPIDGWLRKPKFERSTLLPRRESASTYDTELVNDLNIDSGIDMPDRYSECSSNHGRDDEDKTEKAERTITHVDLQTPLNEDHVVEEILEDKDVVIPSALDRLIDIVGD